METRFFLSRHGETQWNKLKKLQGQLDSPLTNTGLIQANKVASFVQTQSIDLIVSSPLKRAFYSSKIIQQQLQCPIIQQPKLMERHFGDWQGQFVKDIKHKEHYSEIFNQVSEHKPPNGESTIGCALRFQEAVVEIAKNYSQQNILIVSHGDIIRCFLSYIGLTHINGMLNQYNNGCLITISLNHKTMQFSSNINLAELSN